MRKCAGRVRALVFILNYMSKKGVPAKGGTQNPLHLSLFAGNLAPRICGRCPQPAIFLTLPSQRFMSPRIERYRTSLTPPACQDQAPHKSCHCAGLVLGRWCGRGRSCGWRAWVQELARAGRARAESQARVRLRFAGGVGGRGLLVPQLKGGGGGRGATPRARHDGGGNTEVAPPHNRAAAGPGAAGRQGRRLVSGAAHRQGRLRSNSRVQRQVLRHPLAFPPPRLPANALRWQRVLAARAGLNTHCACTGMHACKHALPCRRVGETPAARSAP